MASDLIMAWRMSEEANLFLLSQLPRGALSDSYGSRTRTVAAQFAHLHSVRLRWLSHSAPDLVADIEGLAKGAQPNKTELKRALKRSSRAIEKFIERCEKDGAVKNWEGGPASFVAYLVAHEAHHRGLAMVAMRTNGRKLPQETVYGLWQWGKKRSLRG